MDTVVDRFRASVRRHPDRIALKDEHGDSLTYAEVLERAEQLALQLASADVGLEDRCALYLDRTVRVPIAMLAVLFAGAAYIPIDLGTPAPRIRAMLADASVRVVLSCDALEGALPEGPWRVLSCDVLERSAVPDGRLPQLSAGMAAYVMYTSGSEGRPKGVVIQHHSVVAFVDGVRELYQVDSDEVYLLYSSVAFDVATFDVYTALFTGARLVVASQATRRSVPRFQRLLRAEGVTFYMGTPGVLELLDPEALPALRTMAVGGQAIRADVANRWSSGRRFYNSYGPTETTVAVVAFHCAHRLQEGPPIGTPMPSHEAFILGPDLRPVADGESGELCIGGPGLCRGYLGLPRKTAASLIPHPLSSEPGRRLYRTGDRARRLPDGQIRFLGRLDRQVKVRGVRVEPAEIETVLNGLDGVRQSAVEFRSETGRLVAYVVFGEGTPTTPALLRRRLAQVLPDAMVPSRILPVDQIALASTGKVDWSALRDQTSVVPSVGVARPATPTESTLEAILCPVLDLPAIGRDQDLFELGMDSLGMIRLHAGIERQLGVELPLPALFEFSTISGLAEEVDRLRRMSEVVDRGGEVPEDGAREQ